MEATTPYQQENIVMESAIPVQRSSEYTAEDFVSSSAARVNAADTTRRFIRTAEMHFETADIIRATYAIEDIIARHGGFVASTELTSTVQWTESVRVSRDSTLNSEFYNLYNTMELRVPYRRLDTTLKEIATWAISMDYRRVGVSDVRLSLIRNDLTRRRAARQQQRLENSINEKDEKLNRIAAEEHTANLQFQADEALLSNMELKDRIEYSTVKLQMRQAHVVKRIMEANKDNIYEYRPGFGIRCADALKTGWEGFVAVVVFLTHLWTLWLIVACVFTVIRYYRRWKRKK